MDQLYQQVNSRLAEAVEQYMDSKITLEELRTANMEEQLVYSHRNWPAMIREAKQSVFQKTTDIFRELNELEKQINSVKAMADGREYEISEDALLSSAQLLGRNRMPPAELLGSSWFVGPFPTLQMLSSLREDRQDKPEEASRERENDP